MSSLDYTEDQAAAWLAKRDAGDWQPSDQAEFTAWLEAATTHRVAYLRLERIWEEAGRLQVLAAGKGSGAGSSQAVSSRSSRRPPTRRLDGRRARKIRFFAAAATVLVAVAVGAYLSFSTPGGEHFTTPVGGTASVPLSDGSHITLNTATEVRVDLSEKERHVNLEKGEGFFVVAKDSKRPFVVEAGNKRVVAVGTQFSVMKEGDDIRVIVAEGTVRMEERVARPQVPPAQPQSLSSSRDLPAVVQSAGSAAVLLPAGTIARARDGDVLVEEHSLPKAQEALSWREGYLTFHETTLSDAITEFNRYNERKIRIDDPAVAAIRISGTFRPTNYEAFIRLLRDGFSIRAVDAPDGATLTLN
jgi:transmembrane sensor